MESIMAISLEEISTITAKGQTTIPKAVRQALGVDYGGRIAFRVSDGGVTICRADSRRGSGNRQLPELSGDRSQTSS
jgi:AbrB family looped-hinge helix DNA binding protein